MSTKIASLYAEIGGDASGFKRAASDAKQELASWSKQASVEAKAWQKYEQQKQRELAKTARETKKAAAESAQNFKQMATVGAAAFTAVATGAVKAYQAFQSYAGSVRDVALASGTGAIEASKLIQALDDYQITAEDVLTATKAMTKNGMEPSIETLAKLADEYVKINDPMEKNQFILKNLGKAGLQWANALSQGGAALRAMGDDVNESLILTDEQIKKAEQARLAVDAWGDAWEGFKVSIGSGIGGMIAANAETEKLRQSFEELGMAEEAATSRLDQGATPAFDRFRNTMEKGAAMTEFYKKQLGDVGEQAIETGASLEELSSANADLIKDAISIQESSDKYNETQQETLDKITELQAKKGELYPWERDKLAEINEQISEQKEKYAESAEEFGKAQGEKLVMLALEQIALSDGVAGYSEAEAAKAKLLLDTANIAEESAFRQAIAFDQAAAAIANGTMRAEDMKNVLEEMSKGYTVDVAINITEKGYAGYGYGASYATSDLQYQNPQTQNANNNFAGGMVGSFAGGGKAGGWGLVGDRQGGGFIPGVSELIYGNARVFNSRDSAKMLKSGRFGKVPGFAGGGMTAVAGKKKPWGSTLGGGNGGGEDGDLSTISNVPEMQAISAQVSNEVAQQVAAQVNITMQAYMATFVQSIDSGFAELGSIMRDANPRAVGKYAAAAFVQSQV